jgi:hypothetical protein
MKVYSAFSNACKFYFCYRANKFFFAFLQFLKASSKEISGRKYSSRSRMNVKNTFLDLDGREKSSEGECKGPKSIKKFN